MVNKQDDSWTPEALVPHGKRVRNETPREKTPPTRAATFEELEKLCEEKKRCVANAMDIIDKQKERLASHEQSIEIELKDTPSEKIEEILEAQMMSREQVTRLHNVIAELERRLKTLQHEEESVQSQIIRWKLTHEWQPDIDAKALDIAQALLPIIEKLDALRDAEEEIMDHKDITPYVWFPPGFATKLRCRLAEFYKTRKERGLGETDKQAKATLERRANGAFSL